MKITRVYAQEYAKKYGLIPLQIDGIPEGFSFKEPDITIGDIEHKGRIVTFKPLADFNDIDSITYGK